MYAVDILHADAVGYGILSASLEAGTLLMALILIVLPPPTHAGRVLLIVGRRLRAGDDRCSALSTSLPLSVAAYALVGMADQVSMIMRQNTIQLNTPDALRGRVTAVELRVHQRLERARRARVGPGRGATSAVFAVVSGGVACLIVVGLVAWRIPALRRYRTPIA